MKVLVHYSKVVALGNMDELGLFEPAYIFMVCFTRILDAFDTYDLDMKRREAERTPSICYLNDYY